MRRTGMGVNFFKFLLKLIPQHFYETNYDYQVYVLYYIAFRQTEMRQKSFFLLHLHLCSNREVEML
jgi:hypothetical protein